MHVAIPDADTSDCLAATEAPSAGTNRKDTTLMASSWYHLERYGEDCVRERLAAAHRDALGRKAAEGQPARTKRPRVVLTLTGFLGRRSRSLVLAPFVHPSRG